MIETMPLFECFPPAYDEKLSFADDIYRSIDLFAGIGGIRKGFDNAFGDAIRTVFVSGMNTRKRPTVQITTIPSRLRATLRRSPQRRLPPLISVWRDFRVRHFRWRADTWGSRITMPGCVGERSFLMLSASVIIIVPR